MDLHVSGCNTSNQTLHTIRRSDGTWQNPYGNILGAVPNVPSPFRTIDLDVTQEKVILATNILHEVMITEPDPLLPNFNQVIYTKRNSNGSWIAFENLTAFLNATSGLFPNSSYQKISCAIVEGAQKVLVVVVLTDRGQLIKIDHVLNSSVSNGTWTNGVLIETATNHGRIIDVTCFFGRSHSGGSGLTMHEFFVGTATSSGRAISYNFSNSYLSSGWLVIAVPATISWLSGAAIAGLIRISGAFDNKEHFAVCTSSGQLLHTCSGQSSFGNVNAVNGNVTSLKYKDVSCSFTPSGFVFELQMVAINNDGAPFHTIRKNNGSWQGFMGNINSKCGNSGNMISVGIG
jgi:hypothetical protein